MACCIPDLMYVKLQWRLFHCFYLGWLPLACVQWRKIHHALAWVLIWHIYTRSVALSIHNTNVNLSKILCSENNSIIDILLKFAIFTIFDLVIKWFNVSFAFSKEPTHHFDVDDSLLDPKYQTIFVTALSNFLSHVLLPFFKPLILPPNAIFKYQFANILQIYHTLENCDCILFSFSKLRNI